MVKFTKQSKLSSQETQTMIMDLCTGIAALKNSREAAQLLTDLLGKQELEMIAKRLKIAELLLKGNTYEEINRIIKVSYATIARVQLWLRESGEGYRLAVSRTKSKRDKIKIADEPVRLSYLKRKYPMYYWPQMMIEYWIKNSTIKEKNQMRNILEKISEKKGLYKQLNKLLIVNK
jgi:TrpR-related protein YerC/YecD